MKISIILVSISLLLGACVGPSRDAACILNLLIDQQDAACKK